MSAQPTQDFGVWPNPVFVLLWNVDPETKRPTEPAVTFTPRFPGDGFNHTFFVDEQPGTECRLDCPCGMKGSCAIKGLSRGEYNYTVAVCPDCYSWHSIKWVYLRPAKPRQKAFIQPG